MGAGEIKIFVTPNTVLYTREGGASEVIIIFGSHFPFVTGDFRLFFCPQIGEGGKTQSAFWERGGDRLLFGGGGKGGGGGATPCFANWLVSPEKKRGQESFLWEAE